MAIYKADKLDFDAAVMIAATDSEGNVINDSPIPAGFMLTVLSDNPAAISATQDTADPKLIHYHVGGPGQANVQADLFDASGNLVATGAELVTVTVGDPAAITSINLNLPSA